MKGLNNRFDTSNDFLDELFNTTKGGFIEDYIFSQALEEFNLEEEAAMEIMLQSTKYHFVREQGGFSVYTIEEAED